MRPTVCRNGCEPCSGVFWSTEDHISDCCSSILCGGLKAYTEMLEYAESQGMLIPEGEREFARNTVERNSTFLIGTTEEVFKKEPRVEYHPAVQRQPHKEKK